MPWFIPQPGFLERLTEEEKIRMGTICPPRTYRRGEAIFRPGDPCQELIIVLDGTLKVSRLTERGQERILYLVGPGDILGANFLDANAQYHAEAVCLNDEVRICPVNRDQFIRVAKELPNVSLSLCGALAQRLEHLEDQLEAATAPVAVRLGRVLVWLAQRFGKPAEAGWYRIESELRQEDLAALASTTRVTVTHTLSMLRQAGLVEGTRGTYRVRLEDLEAYLEDLAWED